MAGRAEQRAESIDGHSRDDDGLASEAIAEEAEHHAAEGGHQKGCSEQQRRIGGREMKVARDRDQQKRIEDQVVEVENPRREA